MIKKNFFVVFFFFFKVIFKKENISIYQKGEIITHTKKNQTKTEKERKM